MINDKEFVTLNTVQFDLPLIDNTIQFISVKGWEGQVLKMDLAFARDFLKNYMRILISDELRQDKKFVKKIIDLNNQLKRYTELGIIYIIWENYKGGNVFIQQSPNIQDLADIDFAKEGWNKLTEILVLSKKDQFGLSLRTAVEAKLLKEINQNKKFKLLNDKKDIEEKVRLSEFQLQDLDVRVFFNNIKTILTCLSVDLLK